MMKMNFRRILWGAASGATMFAVALPALALDPPANPKAPRARWEERKENVAERKVALKEAKCETIMKALGNVAGRLDKRGEVFQERRENWALHWQEKIANQDEKLLERRAKQDEQRTKWSAVLDEKADTDAEKAAIAAFRKTVEQAVATRRSATDKAIQDFRTGVQNLRDTRKSSVSTASLTFQSSVRSALDKAKSQCADDIDPKTVQADLHASLKTAREQFRTDRQSFDKIGDDVVKLAEARRTVVKQALETFKKTVETARTALKAVLGEE